MNKLLRYATLLAVSQLAAGCQHDADIRPSNYDELALGTGHWEWDHSTLGWAGNRSPATEGYTRQLVFGTGGQLLLRRSGQSDYRTSYQLSMGPLPRCGYKQASFPLITYSTSEEKLPNNERKTYAINQQSGQQVLSITGEDACVDGGAYETYHWVAE
ncbi:hypothetical protein A0257_06570 [Hymenobacter psoromatis]|nr:hypothetical protein A0257_06570 [Hymenobacter psoromatis]